MEWGAKRKEIPQKKIRKSEVSMTTLHVVQDKTLSCEGVESIPTFPIYQALWTSILEIPTVYRINTYNFQYQQPE